MVFCFGGGGLPWAGQHIAPSFELIESAVFEQLRMTQRAA
jgi:hypothetical protein